MTETANKIPDWAQTLPNPEQYAGRQLPDPSEFFGGLEFFSPQKLAEWLTARALPPEKK